MKEETKILWEYVKIKSKPDTSPLTPFNSALEIISTLLNSKVTLWASDVSGREPTVSANSLNSCLGVSVKTEIYIYFCFN